MRSARLDPDRYLITRNGNYTYKRRVPANVAGLDARAPHIRISLKTADLALARMKRDEYEDADDAFWARLLMGDSSERAREQYLRAAKRAEAMGFIYRPGRVIAMGEFDQLRQRIDAVLDERTPVSTIKAVLGHEEPPAATITEVYRIYTEEIARHELQTKSPNQRRHWLKLRKAAVTNFVKLVGDKPIAAITREDGRKLFTLWNDRINPKQGKPTHEPSTGNRDIGALKVMYDAYFTYMGDEDRSKDNPFMKFRFSDNRGKKRVPFTVAWIVEKFLQPGPLATLNDEARGLFLALIETGARPSELCNLTADQIVLNDPVPHVAIMHRVDQNDPREVKTANSIRDIPLVGVALPVFRKFPNGFPRYKDKEDSFSAAVNKFLKEHELLPDHGKKNHLPYTVYSLRHSFEDRMKVTGIGDETRKIIFGHKIDREEYGEGGNLYWRQQLLTQMALPFDPSIV